VDNVLPDFQTHMSSEEYYHPDFGLRMPARPSELGIEDRGSQYIDFLLQDSQIVNLLGEIKDQYARKQILLQVICDMELALRHGAFVLSSTGRKLIMQRISILDPQYNAIDSYSLDFSNVLSHYGELVIPDFEIGSIDLLYRIKTDKEVRKYGSSFVNLLKGLDSKTSKLEFAKLIEESGIRNSRHESINKFSGLSAQIISGVSLFFDGGIIAGIAAIALGETQRATNLLNSNWVELKPRMIEIADQHKLQEYIRSQEN
ncbi:TPA: hypothetical protein ACPXMY_003642, partial [Vibrio metoecus]